MTGEPDAAALTLAGALSGAGFTVHLSQKKQPWMVARDPLACLAVVFCVGADIRTSLQGMGPLLHRAQRPLLVALDPQFSVQRCVELLNGGFDVCQPSDAAYPELHARLQQFIARQSAKRHTAMRCPGARRTAAPWAAGLFRIEAS